MDTSNQEIINEKIINEKEATAGDLEYKKEA